MNQESRIMGIKNRIKTIIHNSLFMIRSRGFTLIELLVAIAIIGILSAFLLANFVGVRQRSRDGVRKSDLFQIQAALELYRSDQTSYPTSLYTVCNSSLTGGSPAVTYMQKIPCDPSSPTLTLYTYSFSGNTYSLIACLENGNDLQADKNSGGTNNDSLCNGTTTFSYTLQNP